MKTTTSVSIDQIATLCREWSEAHQIKSVAAVRALGRVFAWDTLPMADVSRLIGATRAVAMIGGLA